MSTINTNNTQTISTLSKLSKFEDSKYETLVIKNNISMKSNCFIQNTIYRPSMTRNLKSQFEELQKLQSEINYMEARVKDLEVSKRHKQAKVYIN
jgi:hypothetical protein